MTIELVAIIRRINHASGRSPVVMTLVDLIYPDGRDCGVPLFVDGYKGVSELLMKFGVTPQELEKHRVKLQTDSEVSIPLIADEAVVRNLGFNPR